MKPSRNILKPDISKSEALKLVKIIKNGSDYSGVLVMMSLAKELRYITYSKPACYSWKLPKQSLL